jgi:hypothetical protein
MWAPSTPHWTKVHKKHLIGCFILNICETIFSLAIALGKKHALSYKLIYQ